MIEHFHEAIDGNFTFPDFYRKQALRIVYQQLQSAQPRPHLVEVGVKNGCSAAFLAVELHNVTERAQEELRGETGESGFSIPCPILDLVDISPGPVLEKLGPVTHVVGKLLRMRSWDAANHFEDASLDLVFLDADHEIESVRKDIAAWLPKVRRGGVLAGHDFSHEFPGVMRAVVERFQEFKVHRGSKWPETGAYFPVWWLRVFEGV
jgi:hypothetical protein